MHNIGLIYSITHAYFNVLHGEYYYPCRTYKCACIAHAWACAHLTFHLISMHRYTFLYATKCRTLVSKEIGFIIIFVSLLWKLSFIKSNIDHYYKKKQFCIWYEAFHYLQNDDFRFTSAFFKIRKFSSQFIEIKFPLSQMNDVANFSFIHLNETNYFTG